MTNDRAMAAPAAHATLRAIRRTVFLLSPGISACAIPTEQPVAYARVLSQLARRSMVPYRGILTETPEAKVATRGYTDNKDAVQKRLRRIEGQVRGLQRMVDEDQYCIDILTQLSAATSALRAVAVQMLEDHLGHCV